MNRYNTRIIVIITLLSVLLCTAAHAKRQHHERYYQDIWCEQHNGQTEVVLHDGTRVDCLTDTHAIEFDFANKWAEAVGQSLHYSALTEKEPGIVLIIEDKSELRFLQRLLILRDYHALPITIWRMVGWDEGE